MAEEKQSYGYGKRPLWQWVVIYLIVGGIVYAGIYYFFLAKKGSYNYSSSNKTYTAPTMSPSNQPTSSQNLPTQGTQQNQPANNYKY